MEDFRALKTLKSDDGNYMVSVSEENVLSAYRPHKYLLWKVKYCSATHIELRVAKQYFTFNRRYLWGLCADKKCVCWSVFFFVQYLYIKVNSSLICLDTCIIIFNANFWGINQPHVIMWNIKILGKPSKKKGQIWDFGSTFTDPSLPAELGPHYQVHFFLVF